LGLALVQRLVPTTSRKEHNDVAGFIYAVVGVIYAVLLGLVGIDTWDNLGFPLMEQGRTPSMERSEESSRGWVLIDDIRASLQEVEPRTVAGQELYAEELHQGQR